ncbi:hypothetical protein ABI59_00255 [Acidobacteria bacterium Mor1]|nr:hypothetical protein ABI59_00255 [Acidobacteria bacterium Mor1]
MVCAGIFADAPWAQSAYGGSAPARSILLSVYRAILAVAALHLGPLAATASRLLAGDRLG